MGLAGRLSALQIANPHPLGLLAESSRWGEMGATTLVNHVIFNGRENGVSTEAPA